MHSIYANKVFLDEGWQHDVRLKIDNGYIEKIEHGVLLDSEDISLDIVIPGLCNAHSHSFQRALSGHAEYQQDKNKDNFWTWRKKMYHLVDQIDASRFTAIVTQAYLEMIANGYTSVIEFHYLHREGRGDDFNNLIFHALLEAANASGIRLIYTPILYQRGGFLDEELSSQQRKFYTTTDELLNHYEYAESMLNTPHSLAIGVHSLRAVTEDALRKIVEFRDQKNIPIHIHISEQQKEVDDFYKLNNLRPVEWLLKNFKVDENWCLVHAIHINDEELDLLAKSGAVVCICPTTEANLGDGIFKLKDYLKHNGLFAIGSDSNISINPFEELRWLEYVQRLITKERNIASNLNMGSGQYLFNKALVGGAKSTGNSSLGAIKQGGCADLLALSNSNPSLAGHNSNTLLDAIVFSNQNVMIEKVMIHGKWVTPNELPELCQATRKKYQETVDEIFSKELF